ncbi:MAG: DegT/DnrJ/EryC1/StrS family aminotransferase [Nitrospirota bacterium]|nr:DegT/DnrJ/EryC1/StrS family aminotransferase [Nitrospirota bacterium]
MGIPLGLLKRMRWLVGSDGMKIPLAQPDLTWLERKAVLDVLESNFLSLGPKLPEFERAMAQYIGVKHAIAVNSGTSGLHLIVRALGIGRNDEVITTPFSFIASANCVLMESARPVFVDIDPESYNIDPDKVEAAITPRTKAILGVDVFGRCAEWDRICEIAQRRGLAVIEDSCEAIGAETFGKMAGSFGDAGCLAFYPNKQMTTGEGGMILTNRDDVAALCRSMRNQGRDEGQGWLEHARLGFNYRLSDIHCALGLAQLSRIEEILAKRAAVADMYREQLGHFADLLLPMGPRQGRLSWFVYVVRLADRFTRADRNRILLALRDNGIGCNSYFAPIHLQPFYVEQFGFKTGDFPVTEHISDRTIALPFFTTMTSGQVAQVAACLTEVMATTEAFR